MIVVLLALILFALLFPGVLRFLILAALALVGVLFVMEAGKANEAQTISSFDYIIDGRSLLNKRIVVKDCMIAHAWSDFVECQIYKSSDKHSFVGQFPIKGNSMDRESLRKAISNCSESGIKKECAADVEGTPFLLDDSDTSLPWMKDAKIIWHQ